MTSISSKTGFGGLGLKTLAAVGAFGFAALGTAVVGTSPEQVIAGRFATALEQAAPAPSVDGVVQVAGTEEFWLRAGGRTAQPLQPAAWSHAPAAAPLAFAVGDKLTVTREGEARTFTVVSVSAPFKEALGLAVRVTAADAGDQKAAPVVFTVPAPAKPEAAKPRAS